jgi:hypothetical protein
MQVLIACNFEFQKYETDWTDQVQKRTTGYEFKKLKTDLNGQNESVEIHKRDGFLNLSFKVNLSVLSIVEWDNNMLFARLNT